MAILHGTWILQTQGSYLFIWGETWRRVTPSAAPQLEGAQPHPLAMTPADLAEFLKSLQQTGPLKGNLSWSLPAGAVPKNEKGKKQKAKPETALSSVWKSQEIALPTHIPEPPGSPYPAHSAAPALEDIPPAYLYPWRVEGLCLDAPEAIKFLQALPLGAGAAADAPTQEKFVGADLRFWSHVARWSLDLLARSKFLPALELQEDGSAAAIWQPLLDSATDRERLERFAKQMPPAARTYSRANSPHPAVDLPPSPQELLRGVLSTLTDAQVRKVAGAITPETGLKAALGVPVREWLQALGAADAGLPVKALWALELLETALKTWTEPVQRQMAGQNQFRTGFYVRPPKEGKTDWKLEYYLQAADSSDFLVSAKTVWSNPVERLSYLGRTIEQPQETLLSGLGLASKLYPPIEASLNQASPEFCSLAPVQAYEFLKTVAWRFQDSGLGVIMPPTLANREGWANRLGLSIRAEAPKLKASDRLGLQSLLNFKWELTIGGQRISQAEFNRLVALNSPLVEINGEWVELRQQDVRAAQEFFKGRKDKMALSLEDALRLATGDTQTIEKLPVVTFEAGGALQALFSNLMNSRAVEPIPVPQSFRGELRPYQARGAGWLAFLERWGLGACLADDMGLGKCLAHDTEICINGMVAKAEAIWERCAGETEFDGEGFWADPTEPLLVNSIDEETGKIVQSPVRRLYRQRVRERVRKVKLSDGSSITITRRHKLLGRDGWTNDLKVGDWVCLPAKLLWEGVPADPDLVKFVAWQIGEGFEEGNWGCFNISQNDTVRLEELRQTFHRIGQRYNLKINRPSIQTFPGKVPVLRVSSQAYRQFLEAKGYRWGKRSRDKSIPPFIMQADPDSVRIFLRNYFDAEGSVPSDMRSIEISTASPLLIQQLSVLLRRFGIWLRIAPKQKCATNGRRIYRTYYIGTFGGNSARRFLQEIGFSNPEKQQKLEFVCLQSCNTNVEGIPASDIVAGTVQMTKLPVKHLGIHCSVYINGSQEFSRTSLERVVAGMDRILTGTAEQEYRQLKPSKWTVKTLNAYAQLDMLQLRLTRERLQRLLDLEVFYCPIEAIEDVEYDGWVYDFEVSGHHNFVANNILCHNTIQTIAFLLHLKEQDVLEAPVLLVCPTSVLGNWQREVKKFGPPLKVMLHHGDKRAKGKAFAKAISGKDLVITSYPLLQRDAKDLQSVSWQGVVVDEAQNIKNPEAKQSQAARELQAQFRIALTGTPVENRLQELWSILDFLNPGYLGARQFFQRRFGIPIEKYGDTASLQTLRSLVQPFILRRLKTDREIIQDLPEKQEMTVFCGLAAEQAQLYQKMVEASLAEIESAEGLQRRGMILALLVKLKQICNHPAQFLKESALGAAQRSGKLQRLEEMLEEVLLEGDRALIFTQFAEWGKLLKPHLERELGREVLFLYGSTRSSDREEMIDRFQHDPQGPPIMILSLKAGGTGLNLTRANHVFHFDRWWNPAVENQATDRVFRIGQTRNVQVHKFVCTGTLEEKIHDMIESKKALADQVVGAGEQWLTELDTDGLRNLLLLDRNAVIDEE